MSSPNRFTVIPGEGYTCYPFLFALSVKLSSHDSWTYRLQQPVNKEVFGTYCVPSLTLAGIGYRCPLTVFPRNLVF